MTGKTPFDLQAYLRKKGAVVERALESFFPEPEGPESVVIEAMKYSLFAGGKRLRPILCIAGAETVGGTEKDVLPVACAFEMIHTYSLIHDDLPPMDDDDLRRGRPSNHKVFGEAVALLAGDGLLTEAFHLMAGDAWAERASSPVILKVIGLVSRAAGCAGMVGGQVVDVTWEGKAADLSIVEYIHTHKTGALIKAALVSGAMLAGGSERQVQAVSSYGEKVGLAFQISDDILDIEGDSKTMGKQAGADVQKGKATYPAVAGLEEARAMQSKLVEEAIESLSIFDHAADPLRGIARYIIERKK